MKNLIHPKYQLPQLVVHADWGTNPKKRWMAKAMLTENGTYFALYPELVGEPTSGGIVVAETYPAEF